ncbi:MAG: hypothetical protein HOV83_07490 [Catenulispora sp.]|nr:hypothetical protein [Catenulispora sp.]
MTEDALVSLTNRGLYKRAAKEVAGGGGPTVDGGGTNGSGGAGSYGGADGSGDLAGGGVVRGTFPDGVVCALPPGGLEAAECGCGASGACRHVVAVVLAYQASVSVTSTTPDPAEDWSPGEFSDEELEALLGKRSLASARRRLAAGCLARVHLATPEEPVPWVELPNCSVRFLVPRDLAYARSDARDDKDVIALAVWAWRTWSEQAAEVGDRYFSVGGAASAAQAAATDATEVSATLAASPSSDPLASALDLATDIFLTGVANLAA